MSYYTLFWFLIHQLTPLSLITSLPNINHETRKYLCAYNLVVFSFFTKYTSSSFKSTIYAILSFQSLLRGRFLRNETVEDERPPSTAASELVQLRQRHTVSGIRYAI